jgi:single-strand DNA-binding protein
MNKAMILGRLTRDPEVRYTTTGKVVCQFTVAVDRPFTRADGQKEADFLPCVIWGKAAELCGNSLSKGHRILVEGRIQTRSYEAQDGSKRYVTEIVGDRVEFIERKADGANRAVSAPTNPKPAAPAQGSFDQFGQAESGPFDKEVPF